MVVYHFEADFLTKPVSPHFLMYINVPTVLLLILHRWHINWLKSRYLSNMNQTWKLVNVIGKIGQIFRIFKIYECLYIKICVNISYKIVDLLFSWQNNDLTANQSVSDATPSFTFIGISAYMMEPLLDNLLLHLNVALIYVYGTAPFVFHLSHTSQCFYDL